MSEVSVTGKKINLEHVESSQDMGAIIQQHDWSSSSLGNPGTWPQALHTSLQFLLHTSAPMFLLWGGDHIIFYNNAYNELLNAEGKYTASIGKKAKEAWPGRWLKIEQAVNSILDRKRQDVELKEDISVVRKGGAEQINVLVHLRPVVAGPGMVAGVYATCSNILHQPQTEKFDENEYRYRTLIEEATVATAIYEGPDFIIRYANDIMIRLWGKDKSVIGKTLKDALPELEGQLFFPLLHKVFTTGEPYIGKEDRGDLVVDGRLQTFYFNYTYKALRNPSGEIYAIHNMAIDVTELVLSRKRIEEAEQKRMLAIDSAELGVYEVSFDTNEMSTDNRFNEIWGSERSLSRAEFAAMIHPDDLEGRNKAHEISLKTGRLYYEARIIWKNGTEHWVRVSGKVLYDDAAKPLKLLGVVQNITDQVMARKKIIESERQIRNMILQAPVAMCIFRGPDFIVETANRKMFEIWGREEEEIVNRPVFDVITEAKEQGLEEILVNVYKTGKTFLANERPLNLVRQGKMQRLYLNFVYEPMFNLDGTMSGIFALAIDVSPQVSARQKIEDLERRARLANDTAGLGIYEVDLVENIIDTDTRFNEIMQPGLINGSNDWEQLFYENDRELIREAYGNALQTGSLDYEARLATSNGALSWIKIRGTVLFEGGQPVKLIGVVQDINEQKRFAEALENKVVERTRELETANYQLQQTNIELNQFAYIASHDLQEPLRKVRTFTNILSANMEDASERMQSYMQKIQVSTERMQNLINDVLRFSLLSKEREKFETVDLDKVLKRVLNDYDLLIEQKNAELHYNVLPHLEAIPLQMNQLFTNLVSNALKFSGEVAPLKISITSEVASSEDVAACKLSPMQTYYKIAFRDNGIGFNQENAQQIFTIFQRLHSKHDYSGTGIGLAMCKKIISNHHGEIFATSSPGQGAVFTILLPASQQKTSD